MFEKLIKKIAQILDKEKVPYMIIGGQAVLLYGSPRLTRDIDITLGVDTDKLIVVERACRRINLKILPENSQNFARETKVLPVEESRSRIRIDFIFSFTPYERQAIKRARKVLLGGYPVKFASCEDVIIHKMFAGRELDKEDVRNILIKHMASLNLKYIKKWLLEFSELSEQKRLLEGFMHLLKAQQKEEAKK